MRVRLKHVLVAVALVAVFLGIGWAITVLLFKGEGGEPRRSAAASLALQSDRDLGAGLHARGVEDPRRLPLRGRLVGHPGRAAAARGGAASRGARPGRAGAALLRLAAETPRAQAEAHARAPAPR